MLTLRRDPAALVAHTSWAAGPLYYLTLTLGVTQRDPCRARPWQPALLTTLNRNPNPNPNPNWRVIVRAGSNPNPNVTP